LPRAPRATARSTVDYSTLVLLIAAGALLVAIAYDLGRHHVAGATAFYWAGQSLILLTPAWANLSRSTDLRSRLFTLAAAAAAQSLLTWCYSPDQFRYGDELQHLLTTQGILTTHHLYSPNPILPVSSSFPGLEIVTAALTQLTGLSPFHAGVIVASACHIVLPVAVFLLFRELIGDAPPPPAIVGEPRLAAIAAFVYLKRSGDSADRIAGQDSSRSQRVRSRELIGDPPPQGVTGELRLAGIAAFVYSLNPHYSYYDTLFVYGVPAITLLVLVLRAAISNWRRDTSPLWIVAAFAPLAVTHHVSAFASIVILLAFALAIALSGGLRRGLFLMAISFLLVDDLIAWTDVRGPTTFSYLWDPIKSSFSIATSSKSAVTTNLSTAPTWEHYAGEASALALVLLVLLGIVLTWKLSRDRLPRLLALLGLVYIGILAVRLRSSDGPELSARALTYAMLLIALPVARAMAWLWSAKRSFWLRSAVVAAVPLLLVGAVVTGLPPAWERIPGSFRIASDESGIDARVTRVTDWAATTLPPNQRVACDASVCSMLGARARAIPSTSAAPLYYARSVGALNRGLNRLAIAYIEVDSRMTTQIPILGGYFVNDTRVHPHPISASLLDKFDRDSLLDRVYDDGDIRVYYAGRIP